MRQPDKKTIRILCVCGWGVGSSMMLKMLMDDVISDLNLDLKIRGEKLSLQDFARIADYMEEKR